MSASEKLKALEEGLNVADPVAQGLQLQAAVLAVRSALPQIRAVVEAAELALSPYVYRPGGITIMDYPPGIVEIADALAALDEALP